MLDVKKLSILKNNTINNIFDYVIKKEDLSTKFDLLLAIN